MNRSACIAERFATVSSRDSPLVWELAATFRLMTSADRRLAAISNVVRVRVEGSKKRLNTLLPRSRGTFFTSRSVTPTNEAAVSRMPTSTARGKPSIDSRWRSSPLAFSCGLLCMLQLELELAPVIAQQAQTHTVRHLDLAAAVLSADRQFASAAIGQHHQRDARRPAVVEQFVHRRAHRAPGI